MLVQWGVFIVTGQVPEFQTEPIRIVFHLAAEATTAIMLILTGIGLLRRRPGAEGLGLMANGMLLYTVIVSPGYFAQQAQWAPVVMFGVVIILALVSIALLLRSYRRLWCEMSDLQVVQQLGALPQ